MLTSQVRVCTYDRLNVGRSDSDPGRHTDADSVRDLHALLQTAGVPGPYLLVGFSFGGLLAIMYAGTYPDPLMGLVSLDGSLPPTTKSTSLSPRTSEPRRSPSRKPTRSGWSSTAPWTRPRRWWPRSRTCR